MKAFKTSLGDEQVKILVYEEMHEVLSFTEKTYIEVLGIDIETEKAFPVNEKEGPQPGLDARMSKIRLLQIYDGEYVHVFDMRLLSEKERAAMKAFIAAHKFAAHYGMFERMHFYNLFEIDVNIACTMVLAQMVERATVPVFEPDEDDDKTSRGFGLAAVTKKWFGILPSKELQNSDWNADVLSNQQIVYAALDAVLTYKLYSLLHPKVIELGMGRDWRVTKAAAKVVREMQWEGMRMNLAAHDELLATWNAESARAKFILEKEMYGVNPNSTKQLGEWLEANVTRELLAVWPRTEKGAYSFSSKKLQDFRDADAINALCQYKAVATKISSFGESLKAQIHPLTNRIHAQYNEANTASGRYSCSNPNLQNQPREKIFRKIFIPADGKKLVVSDFNAIEPRICAEVSGDTNLIEAFRTGADLYKALAAKALHKSVDEITPEERTVYKSCFSGDTEVLTKEGWVRLDEYKAGEVAQYKLPASVKVYEGVEAIPLGVGRFRKAPEVPKFDGIGGEISFVTPIGKVTRKDSKTLTLKNREISIVATPDHNMLVLTKNNHAIKDTFENISKLSRVQFIVGGWYARPYIVSKLFTRIMIMTLADGCVIDKYSKVQFGFVKRKKAKRCYDFLKEYGLSPKWKTYKNSTTSTGDVVCIHVKSEQFVKDLREFFDKKKTLKFLQAIKCDPYVLLDELQYWDSSVSDSELVTFCSTNKTTANTVQAVCATTGIDSSMSMQKEVLDKHSNLYRVTYSLRCKTTVHVECKHISSGDTQTTYCLEVPSGYLLLRHHGHTFVAGNCTLGLAYGMGPNKLKLYIFNSPGNLRISDQEAQKLWDDYHRKMVPEYSAWCGRQRQKCERLGYVETVLGRRRKLSEKDLYTCSINHVIQGSAAEVMKAAMAYCQYYLEDKGKIIGCVHDEMLIECVEENAVECSRLLEKAMIDGFLYVFPKGMATGLAEAKVCSDWSQK